MRWLATILLLVAALASPARAGMFPSQYDGKIKAAAAKWLPGIPWQVLKAQYFQESRLDPAARSSVGAEGIAQFMPATWAAIAPALGYGIADRRLAGAAIEGGAYYMAQLRNGWPKSLGEFGRHDHAMASYNAGPGNIRKAWRLCGQHRDWLDTAECLPRVTGKHAAETQNYILRIWRWYGAML